MKNRFCLWLAASLVLLMGISLSVPAKSAATSRPGFTEADAEFYMPENVFLLIQPGVDIEIIDITIPGDLQPEVTFSVLGASGAGLVPDEVEPEPGVLDAVNVRFMLSYIPVGEENKINYHERFRDNGGVYTDMGGGMWHYKFATVLPDDYEADATHTLAVTARRDLRDFSEYGLERYYDNDLLNFVPSGAAQPMPRDIVTTDACNKCHNPISEHGGTYREVQVCTQCHNPDLLGSEEPGELSYEFSALVHRVHSSQEPNIGTVHYPAALNDCEVCHTGGTPTADMPLVANPNPVPTCDGSGKGMTEIIWGDAGNVEIRLNSADGKLFARSAGAGSAETGNWVTDGKAFFLVDADNAETLQQTNVDLSVYGCAGNAPYDYTSYLTKPVLDEDGEPVEDEDGNVLTVLDTAELHSNWMTRPSQVDCGSCHTNIDWETGEGHAAGVQEDEFCSFCHQPDSGVEFDRSVRGAHTVEERSSQLDGVYVDITSIENTGPGQSPMVTYAVFGKSGPIDPGTMNRLRFVLTGPNEDFDFYLQEDVRAGSVASGSGWSYTFSGSLPADAEGSYSLGFEGRNVVTLETPTGPIENVRDLAENYLVEFAVTDDEAVERDLIVDDAKCESCHSNLAAHGGNRHNGGQYCQTCHAPQALGPTEVTEDEEDSIHFKFMVHKIHRGADLENGYVMEGTDFSEVHFPGDLRDCESCHVDTDPRSNVFRSSAWLPLPEGRLSTLSPVSYITEMQPATAACLSCHDGLAAAQHADANTSDLGESCSTCHGEGKTYSVERVHAR